jgi:outer membrane immunogenic protein
MKTILLSTVAILAAASGASAQDGQFHLGGGYTFLNGEGANFDALTLRGGYDYNEFFGVEGEALIGLGDESVTVGGVTGDVSVDYGFGLFGKAQYPLNEQFSIFARLGYAYYEAEASAALGGQTVSVSEGEGGVAYGVGAEWAFAGPNAVRFDYTRNDLDDAEIDAYTLSYVRRF